MSYRSSTAPQEEYAVRMSSVSLRKSVRKEGISKFKTEIRLFEEVFLQQGYKLDSVIRSDSELFQHSSQESNKVLLFFLQQVEDKCTITTVDQLIKQIVVTIRSLHLDNSEDQIEIETLVQYKKIINSIYEKIAERSMMSSNRSPTNSRMPAQKNNSFFQIYHTATAANHSPIFDYYQQASPLFIQMEWLILLNLTRIKYRAKVVKQIDEKEILREINDENYKKELASYKSIYLEKSANRWQEQFTDDTSHLEIVVLGKRRQQQSQLSPANDNTADQSTANNTIVQHEYELISKVVVEMDLIFACIHPKLIGQQVMQAKVNVQYKDQTEGAPFTGFTTIELGFNFTLDDDNKLSVIDRLLDHYSLDIDRLNLAISERILLINEALLPFSSKIQYRSQKGLEEIKTQQNRGGPCSLQECVIF